MALPTPTNLKPGDQTGEDAITVVATNVGGASTGCTAAQIARETLREEKEEAHGVEAENIKRGSCHRAYHFSGKNFAPSPVVSPIVITDSLPAGLTAVPVSTNGPHETPVAIQGDDTFKDPVGEDNSFTGGDEQEGPPYGLSCATSPVLSCTTSAPVDPGDTLVVTIHVGVSTEEVLKLTHASCEVPAGAVDCLTDSASVSGGGAASAGASDPVTISSQSAPYGVAAGGLLAAASTNQAGAHPNVTTDFFLNTTGGPTPVGAPKDAGFDLPPGLVGTTVGVPRCTMAEVINESNCPRDAMVGTATVIVESGGAGRLILTLPVFNIAPAPGEPAAFAFNAIFFPARLDTSVLSNGDYGVRVSAQDITAGAATYASFITIWGVPAEHNGPGPDALAKNLQGNKFLRKEEGPEYSFGGPGIEEKKEALEGEDPRIPDATRVPLLTNPSQCSTELGGILETDSWEGAGPGVFASAGTSLGTDTGCGQLSFKPGVSMLPDTLEAGAPAGYSFDLNVPQNTEPEGLATPDVKRTSVTLPLGTVISPSAADGLGDCTGEQFELHSGTPGRCPRDSQVGTVRVKTPALEERLTGDVYLASPECDPCTPRDAQDGRMVRLFVQFVGEGESGIVVKLEGVGSINQQTGQITTTFDETPQLPFSEFQLTLQGGERATLANPRTCGEVTTAADLTPWSTPFTPDATATSTFDVDENCFGAQFNPSFVAGTTSNQAGGFSPFTLSFGRSDSQEFLNGVQVTMPPGLLGMLSRVKLCEEPQANAGTCGPESQIGEVTVETGPGADPFLVTGGKVYITGPYRGAPYGLSIVVPAKAGPYTLSGTTGNGTVVNRSAISVNPQTSALTVTSDPLPTELDGIPLQLRLVNVTVGTSGEFTFNPTSCDKLAIGGTLTSTEAASAGESSSFQVTNCGGLAFKPKFSVSTSGKTSRLEGASLDARLTYPPGAQGTEANIARVKVELPKQLPSPLATLQKACTAQTFDTNPAGCPVASLIGTVRVSTPVLPVQLTGPVYFVSNGGEAFPNLEMVLQGDGVRVDLVGDTFISKGITSTTFKTVPDVPFESFELYLPERKYPALVANGNLCKSKLVMPTEFIAQNGVEIHESTPISVTGCPKVKKASRASKASRARNVRKSSHNRRAMR
jgi:hypothetical protein